MLQGELDGKYPVNRPEYSGRKKRIVKSLIGKSTWFKNRNQNQKPPETGNNGNRIRSQRTTYGRQKMVRGQPETVLFIPHTPEGQLKKLFQEIDDQVNGGANLEL